MTTLYDPLTYDNLMAGLVLYFMKQNKVRLDQASGIEGPGIYSLYYSGTLPVYTPIANSESPIYVGKAIPPGSRKGDTVNVNAPSLQRRITEHAKSIAQAENLDTTEFWCRHLAVQPVWITLAERFLIDYFRPVWNLCLDGFGDHDPGSGRRNSERSWWDTMHPGRSWASNLRAVKTTSGSTARVNDFWATNQTGQSKD